MSHALVIGGTGMLKGASIYLAKKYRTVSVVGRNKHRFYSLIRETEHLKGNINSIEADYTNMPNLEKHLKDAISKYGNIETALSWIHFTAPDAPFKIAELLSSYGKPVNFYEALGSAYADPSKDNSGRENKFKKFENIRYRKIILGFVIEDGYSRWLTNEEISSGVIKALETGESEYTVGTMKPWDAKP